MTRQKSILVIAVLLAFVHVLLASLYNFATPYATSGVAFSQGHVRIADIGAPDEIAHAAYIHQLASGGGWPVLDLAKLKSDPAYRSTEYESHQPPLYYAIEAPLAKALGPDSTKSPQQGTFLRIPNALFGGLTVLGVFFAVLWGFELPGVALIAALFPALLPMNTALSGALSNDPLLICLSTWSIACMVKFTIGGWTLKRALLVAVLVALACWTKTTGLLLLPPLLYALFASKENRLSLRQIGGAAALFVLLTAPLWIHNQTSYGDPMAMKAFNQAFGDTAQHSTIAQVIAAQGGNPTIDYWGKWVAWWTFRSFVGVFGYMDIWLNGTGTSYSGPKDPNWLYLWCLFGAAALSFGWLRGIQGELGRSRKTVHWIFGLHLILVTASFIAFNNHYFQAQGRYLYPAIAAISAGLALGADSIFKKRWIAAAVLLCLGLCFLQYTSLTALPSAFHARSADVPWTAS